MILKVIVVQLMFCVAGVVSKENSTPDLDENVLKLNTVTVNGNVNFSTIEIVNDNNVTITEINDSTETTTTLTYEENDGIDLFTMENEQNTDVTTELSIKKNVTNLMIEQTTSVNITESDAKPNENISEEKDTGVSRNLEHDIPTITENSVIDLRNVITKISVEEKTNGEIFKRKPITEELGVLNNAEWIKSDNLAVEDITNIIKVDPDITQNENNEGDDIQDMELIFDERRFRHIKQNSNKNIKEFKIFFTETEGDFPTHPVEEKSSKGNKTVKDNKEKHSKGNEEKIIKLESVANKKDIAPLREESNNKIKEITSEDEIYSIIDSIKKSLEKDTLNGFKITAVSTKNVPALTTTQIPETFVTDSKVFEFSVNEVTAEANSEKTVPYATTENSIDLTTTKATNLTQEEEKTTKATFEAQKELSSTQKDLIFIKEIIPVSNVTQEKRIVVTPKDEKEISPAEVEKFYNKFIDESYESVEAEDDVLNYLGSIKKPIVPGKFNEITDDENVNNIVNNQEFLINNKILNNSASMAIRMGKEADVIYVPSNAHIRETNNVINITWKSSSSSNNSIVLRLTEYDNHYLIREIQLNVPKGDEVFTQKKAVAIAPTSKDEETDVSKIVVMRDGTFIHFSNVEFLRKKGSSGEISDATVTERLYHVEIASISCACAVLVAVALYIVVFKAKARWFNREKKTKEELETKC